MGVTVPSKVDIIFLKRSVVLYIAYLCFAKTARCYTNEYESTTNLLLELSRYVQD